MYRFVVKKTYNKYIRKRKPTIPTNAVVVEKEVYAPTKKEEVKIIPLAEKEEAPTPASVVVEEAPVVTTEEITPKPKRKKKAMPKAEEDNTPKEEETNNGEQI